MAAATGKALEQSRGRAGSITSTSDFIFSHYADQVRVLSLIIAMSGNTFDRCVSQYNYRRRRICIVVYETQSTLNDLARIYHHNNVRWFR